MKTSNQCHHKVFQEDLFLSRQYQEVKFFKYEFFKICYLQETLMPFANSRVSVVNPGMIGGEVMRGMPTGGGSSMTGNTNGIDSGDSLECWEIIQRLLAENCYLKSADMRERLLKLKNNMPKFTRYHQEMKILNETGNLQNSLISLSNKMSNVHKKAQKKLVEAKIIDLEKVSDLSIVQKNENLNKFLTTSNKQLESIRTEAYGFYIYI